MTGRRISGAGIIIGVCCALVGGPGVEPAHADWPAMVAVVQVEPAMPPPQTQAVSAPRTAPRSASRVLHTDPHESILWPNLDPRNLTWFSVVIILVLAFRTGPMISLRNLDALVLAASCVFLALRWEPGADAQGREWRWWGYVLCAAAAGYWVLRGLQVVLARRVAVRPANVSEGALLILVAASALIAVSVAGKSESTQASLDGVSGGLQLANLGTMPYGDIPNRDQQAPMVYLTYAGAAKLMQTFGADRQAPAEGGRWTNEGWLREHGSSLALVTHLVLFGLALLALYSIGAVLHSPPMGLTLMALFAVFPGVLECIGQPNVMVPTVFALWALALALAPGVGGLLGMLMLTVGVLASPWLALGIPVLLAWCMRRGILAFSALLGLAAGIAVCGLVLVRTVQPTLPSESGALTAAGLAPTHAVSVRDGQIHVDRVEPPPPAEELRRYFWKPLLEADDTVFIAAGPADSGDDPGRGVAVPYHRLSAEAESLEFLQDQYRDDVRNSSLVSRAAAALRTVLEAAWLEDGRTDVLPSAWGYWAAHSDLPGERWDNIRRIAKLGALLVAVALAFAVLLGRRTLPHQLVGALLTLAAAVSLVSSSGPVMHLAPMVGLAVILFAIHAAPQVSARVSTQAAPAPPPPVAGRAPRITVDS